MKALIEAELFRQIERDRHRNTASRVDARPPGEVLIRRASAADNSALHRLAMLDSAPDPQGPVLLAEQEGVLVAALTLGDGRSIADPFVPTKDILGLLEVRRAQLRPAA